jgi:hypothetical protein
MRTGRLAVTGVALTALALGATGCASSAAGPATPGDAVATSATADARDELVAAANKLATDTVKVTMGMSGGLSVAGVMNPQGGRAEMTMDINAGAKKVTIDMVVANPDLYLKINGIPSMPAKWLHIDSSKIKTGGSLDVMPQNDPVGAQRMVNGLVDVQRVAEHSYKGTFDMTKSPTANQAALGKLGDKVKTVPFTATTDAQGRLTEMNVDLSAVQPGLQPLRTTYSDFGAPVNVDKPPADQTMEAPQQVLDLFNV